MNIHHLELFFHVARHGGISRAVRHMPYGIQQPAVSGQMRLLEQDLGVRLFERTPFRLTTEGDQLYAFVQPFFDNLEPVAARLRKGTAPVFRVGASEMVLRDHLPGLIQPLRKREPRLRLALRTGRQRQLEAWLLDRQIDFAVTMLETRVATRVRCERLLRLPLVLLVPRASGLKSPEVLWKGKSVEEPLITPPAFDIFQQHLRRLGIEWPAAIEAGSLELVMQYVANGYGIGVSVALPEIIRHPKVRVLPLPGFPPMEVAGLWVGQPTPLIRAILEEGRHYIRARWPHWSAAPA